MQLVALVTRAFETQEPVSGGSECDLFAQHMT